MKANLAKTLMASPLRSGLPAVLSPVLLPRTAEDWWLTNYALKNEG
jgi:hypothetical protein